MKKFKIASIENLKDKKFEKKISKEIYSELAVKKLPNTTIFSFDHLEWQASSRGSDYEMYGQICLYAIDDKGKIIDKKNFISLTEKDSIDLLRYTNKKKKFSNKATLSIPRVYENIIKIYVVFGINEDDREIGWKYYSAYNDQCSDKRTPYYEGGSDDFYVIDREKTNYNNGGWFSIKSNGKKAQEISFPASADLSTDTKNYKTIYMNLHHDVDKAYRVYVRFNISKSRVVM